MPITVTCSTCNAKSHAPDAAAGKTLACPACRAPLSVPIPTPAPSTVTAPRRSLLHTAATVAIIATGGYFFAFCGFLSLLLGAAALGSKNDVQRESWFYGSGLAFGWMIGSAALTLLAVVVIEAARRNRSC